MESSRNTAKRLSAVRSKDTKPELVVRRFLHSQGFRYRLHGNGLPGRPDLVFRKYRTVIFVHGCYWHQHKGCNKAAKPKRNIPYWENKFKNNKHRDRMVREALESDGWKVVTIWECETQDISNLEQLTVKILQ